MAIAGPLLLFHSQLPKDGRGNVITGRTLDLDSKNSLVFSQNRLIATIGLQDLAVVDTAAPTLICPRERLHEVKDRRRNEPRHMPESLLHPTVERPWSGYTIMDAGPGYQVKQIVVDPGKRLSLQLHHHRAEHWVVVQGTAQVTIGREVKQVHSTESVFVPLKTPHRLENPGPDPVRIIEVQTGSYLGEDDIIRSSDDFGRVPEN